MTIVRKSDGKRFDVPRSVAIEAMRQHPELFNLKVKPDIFDKEGDELLYKELHDAGIEFSGDDDCDGEAGDSEWERRREQKLGEQ
jgi:hypothetical protein